MHDISTAISRVENLAKDLSSSPKNFRDLINVLFQCHDYLLYNTQIISLFQAALNIAVKVL
jgi:hypothetical protein